MTRTRSIFRGSFLLAAALGTTACPLIFSVQPPEGEAGATATIAGTCLGTEQQSARVLYDGAEVQVESWSNFEIQVTLPDPKPEGLYSVQVVDVPGLQIPFSNFASHRIVAPAAPFQATFNALDTSLGRSVLQTADGGYVAAGFTELDIGANTREMYLVKTDRAGALQWSATYGSPAANDDAFEVAETADGGYFLAGNQGAFAQPTSIFLVKTDGAGAEQWSHTLDGAPQDARAFAGRPTADGGFIVAG
ncbi:MAG: IPT/TIG domain-containing protein, partial [Myxococcales bacterium]|nr:IPT/TIG domain-containing protein [Myxococcales bacterium]